MNATAQPAARLMVVTTVPQTLTSFFQRQLKLLSTEGFEVHALSSPGPELGELRALNCASIHAVPIRRHPHTMADLLSVLRLWILMLRLRPHLVHAHTPKAGLLAMLAATLAGVPIRLYTIHGLPLETRTGWRRFALRLAERATCALAGRVYCVSRSLEDLALQMKLCPRRKLFTLGDGSCAGIDLERFRAPDDRSQGSRQVRAGLGIPAQGVLLSYVGRLVRDKGIEVLAAAWRILRGEFPDLRLLVCGSEEPEDPVPGKVMDVLRNDSRVHLTENWMRAMPAIYAATDIFVLPTFREGLSQVALECGAMRVPVVASRVAGLVNSVQHGVTGLLVPPGDPQALAESVSRLIRDTTLRRRLGDAGREFIQERFSEQRVNGLLLAEYRGFLRSRLGNAFNGGER